MRRILVLLFVVLVVSLGPACGVKECALRSGDCYGKTRDPSRFCLFDRYGLGTSCSQVRCEGDRTLDEGRWRPDGAVCVDGVWRRQTCVRPSDCRPELLYFEQGGPYKIKWQCLDGFCVQVGGTDLSPKKQGE